MTLKEKMLEIWPENVSNVYKGGVKSCPSLYCFLGGHFKINTDDTCMCDHDCEKCWSQPYIEDYVTDTNVGNKNEITLQEAKLKEIMKQLWQETENVLGNEMVDFYSIERIIRDVLGMDNSEEEK